MAHMDFTAVQKTISHVSARPPSTTDSSEPDTPISDYSAHDYGVEAALTPQISRHSQPPLSRSGTKATTASSLNRDPSFEIDWEDGDPENPRNWSMWYKGFIIFSISFGTLVVVLYSTTYTTGISGMEADFHVSSEPIVTLGVTTYLIGIAVGSLILAPLSETYGRKWVYCVCMACFVLLVLPCALAKSMAAVIAVRFFAAVAGSAMIANSPGTIADIVGDEYRATAFSIWSIGPMNGPVLGPVIGGFVTQYQGWRWANWVVMMAGGLALAFLLLIRETYEPAILQQRSRRRRAAEDDDRYWSRYDNKLPFVQLMKVNLSRPFIMAVTEPICIFWNVYICIIYGILYLCFVAYPIVFTDLRGWSIGISGLSFSGIGLGTMITICSAGLCRRLINAHRRDENGETPPEAMMAIVCIASICIPVGQLWFAWTCYPVTVHWALPIAAGIFFGAGNGGVFIYAGNYLAHSYGIYAASAMAGNAVVRSLTGGTLPLAGPALYKALGPNWAGTLLGMLEVCIIPIPFLFYKYGARIRGKSTLIGKMREIERAQVRKRERAERRVQEAEQAGNHVEEKFARSELTRVKSCQAYGIDADGRVRDVEKEANADLTRLEGVRQEDVEKNVGVRTSRA